MLFWGDSTPKPGASLCSSQSSFPGSSGAFAGDGLWQLLGALAGPVPFTPSSAFMFSGELAGTPSALKNPPSAGCREGACVGWLVPACMPPHLLPPLPQPFPSFLLGWYTCWPGHVAMMSLSPKLASAGLIRTPKFLGEVSEDWSGSGALGNAVGPARRVLGCLLPPVCPAVYMVSPAGFPETAVCG